MSDSHGHDEHGHAEAPVLPDGVCLAPGCIEQSFLEKLYLPEIAKGLVNTFKHMVNLDKFTIQYDGLDLKDRKRNHFAREGYRGEHYLKKDDNGHVKCVACFMCAAACPAECIHIEAEATPVEWKDRERYPKRFEIDLLRCIYCGMCEEACPVDAIALSTTYNKVADHRERKVYDREQLLDCGEKLGLSQSKHHYRPDGVPGAVPADKGHGH